MTFLTKPYRWAAVWATLLTLAFAFVLLDTFVIPKARYHVDQLPSQASQADGTPEQRSVPGAAPSREFQAERHEVLPVEPVRTETSYTDENIRIEIETVRKHDTTLYVVEVELGDVTLLKTAFAQDTFGRNIKATTSAMAEEKDAIFAVNGDYYGFRDNGFVLRNGVLYRETGTTGALLLDAGGGLQIIDENEASPRSLLEEGAWQIWSFGPPLVVDGQVAADGDTEVAEKFGRSNPRTAIGQIAPLHYLFIVSDGRSDESAGLSLLQLAEEFADRGCTVAYNLDGGGSSTMVFGGRVVNNPTNGRTAKERELSDIVYIGYE